MSNEQPQLTEELKERPVPFGFLMPLTEALESRIDYNFNALIQLSLLVEYLYMQLEEKDLKIELDETFEAFQKTRIDEIKSQFENSMKKTTEEEVNNSLQESELNLKDE